MYTLRVSFTHFSLPVHTNLSWLSIHVNSSLDINHQDLSEWTFTYPIHFSPHLWTQNYSVFCFVFSCTKGSQLDWGVDSVREALTAQVWGLKLGCPRTYTMLDLVSCVYNSNTRTERWETETGESLEGHGPGSLAQAVTNKRSCPKQGRRRGPKHEAVSDLHTCSTHAYADVNIHTPMCAQRESTHHNWPCKSRSLGFCAVSNC